MRGKLGLQSTVRVKTRINTFSALQGKLLKSLQCYSQWVIQHIHLIDVDAMFGHVVPVVDLTPFSKLHGQDPLGAQIPVDGRNLQAEPHKLFLIPDGQIPH